MNALKLLSISQTDTLQKKWSGSNTDGPVITAVSNSFSNP